MVIIKIRYVSMGNNGNELFIRLKFLSVTVTKFF